MLILLLAACKPDGPPVRSAEEIGVVEQSADIQGRDGGQSARLFGRSVWTFGDTVLNVPDEEGRNWHHNSVSWTDDDDASDGLSGFVEPLDSVGAPAYLIPPTDEEAAFNDAHYDDGDCEEPCGARYAVWPGSPVWDEENAKAILFYGVIYAEPGDFNFEGRGEGIAVWSDLDATPERGDLIWQADDGEWGNTAAIVDDHLYTFSCVQQGWDRPCVLGRAPLDQILSRDAWTVWTGSGWSADSDDAETLFDGAPIMGLSYNSYLQSWLLVYSAPLSEDIVARTAPELTGPWSRETVLYTVTGEDAPYDAVQHSEWSEDGGRVEYITWSRSTGEGWFGAEFALLRVELD